MGPKNTADGVVMSHLKILRIQEFSLYKSGKNTKWLRDRVFKVLEASLQEEGGKMGAHVVAPCPHDGVCPMEGTKSWCHFTQRFERSGLQRVTKIRPDGGLARTYQVLWGHFGSLLKY